MAANSSDLFKKTGASTVTTLSAPGKALSATSITVGSTTNYPPDTGIVIAIRIVDSSGELVAGTYTEWSATVTSGTTLGIEAVPVYGSDQVYPAGSTTQVYIPLSSFAHNKLIDGVLTSLDQDGTLKAGAVDNAGVLASDVVETAKIKNLNVTSGKLADASVTADKLALGAQQALVATAQTTTSTSFTDLATTTDTVTATIGANGLALVIISSRISNTDSAAGGFVGFAASGTNTIAVSDANSLNMRTSTGAPDSQASWTYLATGLTPGSTTFKMKYRVTAGTGTFTNRRITVIPF